MREVVEALRLRFEQQLSQREIARSLGLAQSSVNAYLARFAATGLPWPPPPEVGEAELEARLFTRPANPPPTARPLPDWPTVQRELQRKGVTLQLPWLEYKAEHPTGYQYTQFCRYYHAWAATLDPVLRQVHVAGERVFVDYAGPTMPVLDLSTGEVRPAQIFVGALGASHLLYVEATWTQTLLGAHVRMLEYFQGVPALIVPDNASALVRHACNYEPEVHPTCQDFATHYATAILPILIASPRCARTPKFAQFVNRQRCAPGGGRPVWDDGPPFVGVAVGASVWGGRATRGGRRSWRHGALSDVPSDGIRHGVAAPSVAGLRSASSSRSR